jgi:hypothetical protein
MNEELAYIDKYLLGEENPANDAFDEKSPLAYELMKAEAKRWDRSLGEITEGILVPETAEMAGMLVGRFEVTRVQYADFDEAYEFPEGTENWPASGIAFEKAAEYCRWLSDKTGRRFRLPTEKEMDKLMSAAEGNSGRENNLDWWAGYALTPDEVPLILDKASSLDEKGLLLKEAGSFPPVGEPGVWDLAGNVAEWATAEGGTGKAMGLSALSPKDKRCKYGPPHPGYIGFRVIEEK